MKLEYLLATPTPIAFIVYFLAFRAIFTFYKTFYAITVTASKRYNIFIFFANDTI